MSRGNCKFETMELKGVENWFSKDLNVSDPFDPTRGLNPNRKPIDRYWMRIFTSPSGMSDETYQYIYRESKSETKRKHDQFKKDTDNDNKDIMEQEFGKIYVSPEEAFGSKSIDIGDTLNKAFED